ncbi:MAG: phage tail sheath family protein [Alphaproteobacteria bacterium]|nr:phage tail sheath family protein [Alphaproteobacteria bacterium]
MPTYATPGIAIEESGAGPRPIEGVATSTAAFIGVAARGGARARLVGSLAEFESHYGPVTPLRRAFLGRAVQGFFANGGTRAWIVRVPATRGRFTAAAFIGGGATRARFLRGLAALAEIDEMLLVAVPDLMHPRMAPAERAMLRVALIAQAEAKRDRIVLLDPPAGDRALGRDDPAIAAIDSAFAAVFGPWLAVADAAGGRGLLPPSGHVAGAIARADGEAGVHRSPAGAALLDVLEPEFALGEADQDRLNPVGLNALRVLPGRGLVVWGARLRTGDPEWRYIAVRRLAIHVERSIAKGLGWIVFETNDEPLWAQVRGLVEAFLLGLWRRGALVGRTADAAFFARCDRSTMTQADIDSGRLVCMIGIAPAKPAEFVILRIGAWTRRDP